MLTYTDSTALIAIAILGFLLLIAIMYHLLCVALDRFPPAGRDQHPETQDDFHLSLQRNRRTQERMGE